jgi:hypothetical protein
MTDLRTRGEALIQRAEALTGEAEAFDRRDSLQMFLGEQTTTCPDGEWVAHLWLAQPRGAPALHVTAADPDRTATLTRLRSRLYAATPIQPLYPTREPAR